jgi:hypothetical protein
MSLIPQIEKEILATIEHILYYEKENLPKKGINRFKKLRESIIGDDYSGLMKRYVKTQLLEDNLKENSKKCEEIIEKLACQSIEKPELLEKELPWLLTPVAENGYIFGMKLGCADQKEYWLKKLETAFIGSKNPSVYFFSGYLASLKKNNEKKWEKSLLKYYRDDRMRKYLLEIIWRSEASDKSAELIIRMLKTGEILPQSVSLFDYGAWFNAISEKEFIKFLNIFFNLEKNTSKGAVLCIVTQYTEKHEDFVKKANKILIKYLTSPEIFTNSAQMTGYYWSKLCIQLLNENPEVNKNLLDGIIKILSKDIDFQKIGYIREVLGKIIEIDNKYSWGKIKNSLAKRGFLAEILSELLKGNSSYHTIEKNSLIGHFPENIVLKWCDEKPNSNPILLAKIIPLHETEPELHPLARKLLKKYPNNKEVFATLSANWGSDSWVGPLSQHYEQKLKIAEQWLKYPELPVQAFAKQEISTIKREIEKYRRDEEEE